MSKRWTPGPWVWRYDNWLVGAEGESVLEASDNGASYGLHSAVISHHYDPAVAAANKRLIAEAPAMAEALKLVLRHHEARDKGDVIGMLPYSDIIAVIRPILAHLEDKS